jgi:hypothetical protein
MALIWIDGFDHSINETTLNRGYDSFVVASGGGTVQYQGMFNGNNGRALGCSRVDFVTKALVSAPVDTFIIGFGFRNDNAAGTINDGDIPYIGVSNSDGEQLRMEFVQANSSNSKPGGTYYKLRIMRGATELASSVDRFSTAQDVANWVYLEWKVVVDDTAGSFEVQYYFPSTQAQGTVTWNAASTGLDTRNQSSDDIDRVTFGMDTGNAANIVLIDDIYICDESGSINNDYLGPVLVQHQKPTAAGTTQQWSVLGAVNVQTALAESVTGAPDDSARVTSLLPTDICLVTVGALALAIGTQTIHGVRQDFIARMDAGSDADVTHFYRKTTGTPAQTAGSTHNVSGADFEGYTEILEEDPNTSSPWVLADIDSYQHGFRNDG